MHINDPANPAYNELDIESTLDALLERYGGDIALGDLPVKFFTDEIVPVLVALGITELSALNYVEVHLHFDQTLFDFINHLLELNKHYENNK